MSKQPSSPSSFYGNIFNKLGAAASLGAGQIVQKLRGSDERLLSQDDNLQLKFNIDFGKYTTDKSVEDSLGIASYKSSAN